MILEKNAARRADARRKPARTTTEAVAAPTFKSGADSVQGRQVEGDTMGNSSKSARNRSRAVGRRAWAAAYTVVLGLGFAQSHPTVAQAARDPGLRLGAAAAGGPIAGLSSDESLFFDLGLAQFLTSQYLADGLGPRFNLDSCGGCHAQPAAGGSSPATNPQPTTGVAFGAKNVIPSFVTANGPIVEARFKTLPNGRPDGQVHPLFVITGRNDGTANASGCTAVQEDFNTQYAKGNVALRIPTPTFGAGLIESISDSAIVANLAANGAVKSELGIGGHPNVSPNTGNVTRFGWKAQNPSLLVFGGEAYLNEIGISNELFPNERDDNPTCQFSPVPNDFTTVDAFEGIPAPLAVSDAQRFTLFMEFTAPPTPSTDTPGGATSITRGQTNFDAVGCGLCHTPTLTTQPSNTVPALSNVAANLYSDLALHQMGPKLADGIAQGAAAGDEFRTAPLWGLGQRIFFLHDGRTKDLLDSIAAHASPAGSGYGPSEANQVIQNFNNLSDSQKQDLLNFLRSL